MARKVFCDMDGVLADFDAHHEAVFGFRPCKQANNVDWEAVRRHRDFYLNIPPMPDMRVLWAALRPLRPIVLTGVPHSVSEASDNKRAWVQKHLGSGVEVRCVQSSEKCKHADPGDVLIDDWEKYKHLWVGAGGVWVTHRKAWRTVHDLRKLGIL